MSIKIWYKPETGNNNIYVFQKNTDTSIIANSDR